MSRPPRAKHQAVRDAFCRRLLQLKDKAGLSWPAFSESVGFGPRVLYGYYYERRLPLATTLADLACAFDVSVDWLLGLTNERSE